MANEDHKDALISTLVEENAKLREMLNASLSHTHGAIMDNQKLLEAYNSLMREYEELEAQYEALKAQGKTDTSIVQTMRTMQQQIRSLQSRS